MKLTIEIDGSAGSTGNLVHNINLLKHRVDSVKNELISIEIDRPKQAKELLRNMIPISTSNTHKRRSNNWGVEIIKILKNKRELQIPFSKTDQIIKLRSKERYNALFYCSNHNSVRFLHLRGTS